MPEEGISKVPHQKILSYEELFVIAKVAVQQLGFTKIRLTGGEPLVRPKIEILVKYLARLYKEGLAKLSMTTNGHFLAEKATLLKKNGLQSVNISLDTLDAEKYSYITRGGKIDKVLAGIDAALQSDFQIKINMVVMDSTSEEEIEQMEEFCSKKGLKLQKISHFSLSEEKKEQYQFDRPPPCSKCNRIRLLANGFLKPCLHSNTEIPLNLGNIYASLQETIIKKPASGYKCDNRNMYEIGG
jgi:cyclic pyranopterin phosphate synthase